MTENQAIKILKEEKSWESDDRKIDAFIMGIEALEKVQAFEAIGTIEEFKALKEKNEPKKPIDKISHIECPRCGTIKAIHNTYCSACGQKLDWK